ncbi:carboxypeptidase-like regulatory domain-containing protein [Gillisia marina]|uniref:carboxypeptidase-like regulatory domain-containing protein n=1 Tax=Gillisia marina TaxID=1167637 RepID=UPI0002F92441|nr:carboxypeptidase-like regulatory domain-containing protein [Gillisia marina]
MNGSLKSLLFLLLFSQFTFAQVIGTVRDSNDLFLPYVNIYTEDGKYGTTTNEDGNFELRLSKTGEYELVFQFLGYQTLKKKDPCR